ncbi:MULTISPECIES: hypothetical protein [unclassified Streptomyces]|uniref:hypothetical protein n=1 Tax=unclassified Streptomyces TaxID=2593676 RepID=UPI00333268EA
MGLLVLLEVLEGFDPDEADPVFVRSVHAAACDPDVLEGPLPTTLCGISTDPLVHTHYQASYGEPWYAAEFEDRQCRDCERVLRRIWLRHRT